MKTTIMAGLLLLAAITSHAGLVTYNYTGVITSIDYLDPRYDPFAEVGTTFRGTIYVDTHSGTVIGQGWIRYSLWYTYPGGLTMGEGVNQTYLFPGSDGYIDVLNDPVNGNFGFNYFSGYAASPFNGTDGVAEFHLLRHSPVGEFTKNSFRAWGENGLVDPFADEVALGAITSLSSRVPDSGSTAALFGLALTALLFSKRYEKARQSNGN